ncbi:MAG: TetR/AcrR family transcriptional regulator, partial [Erythrobacter sp.]
RAGYSVGTIYNVFGGLDAYLIAVNSRTFREWSVWLEEALAASPDDGDARLAALVRAYFAFADAHRNAWMAIYDHRIDRTTTIAKQDEMAREALTGIVDREVTRWLGQGDEEATRRLVRSLIATVHGHCALWLSGSYALMREEDPAGQALARVMEALSAHAGPAAPS